MYIVLPGLDGTDLLLDAFTRAAPEAHSVRVIALPDDSEDDYESLFVKVLGLIAEYGPCHLIAESFSGPLGILLARRHPDVVKRLTLVASFADSPIPFAGRFLPWSYMVRLPMPTLVAKRYFVGADREMAGKLMNAIRHTSRATIVRRIRLLLDVDVCDELSRIQCPVQYIRPTRDRLVPKRCVARILKSNGQVSVSNVDGPHLIMQTRPDHTWAAIKREVSHRESR